MNDDEIYEALCLLLPSQWNLVISVAGVPQEHISPSTAPPATRAGELIAWAQQSAAYRNSLIQALDRVRQYAGSNRKIDETPAPPKVFILPPVDIEGFTGRETELKRLVDLLINGTPSTSGCIVGVYGPPGVGKSGLVAYFARTQRERFSGGVIGVDLRGVKDPAYAVSRFATAQGEPLTLEEQVQPPHEIMQARFANRRMLLVLDNLEHGSALKQLRPGGDAALLITCRNQDVLAQFAVAATNRIPLEALSAGDARQYFETALGSGVHSIAELDALARHLGYLPLALRIAARRLLEDPLEKGRIDRLLHRLRDVDDPLGELVVDGEADLDLIRLFALSLEHLPDTSRRAFACLSACASYDFGVRAAASATGLTDPGPLLARVTRLSLVEINQETARYRFHPLVGDYARHLANRLGLTNEARLRHGQAMAALLRNLVDAKVEVLLDLLKEQPDICHAADYLVEHTQLDLPVLQGLNRLVEHSPLGDWHRKLLERARQRLDPTGQAWLNAVLLLQQGKRAIALRKFEEAQLALEESLAICRRRDDERGVAMVLNSLGGLLRDLGRMDEAHAVLEESLASCRQRNDERGISMVLNSLGGLLRDLGRTDEASAIFDESLAICRRSHDEYGVSLNLNNLGGLLRDQGRMDEARFALEESLVIGRQLHNERHMAIVLHNLGHWFRERGDPQQALSSLEAARRIQKSLGLKSSATFRTELKKLRSWVRRLSEGTHRQADYHLEMAKKRGHAEDWPGAIIHMYRNLALDDSAEDRGDRLSTLAYACFKAERRAEAIGVSKEALATGFESSMLRANLGRALHLEGGCLEESERHLRRSLELNSDNPWAWSWLGLVRADQGHLEEAETYVRKALVAREQHAVLTNNLALVLAHFPDERIDQLNLALQCCEQARKFADFHFPHPIQLAEKIRLRLQSLAVRENPST